MINDQINKDRNESDDDHFDAAERQAFVLLACVWMLDMMMMMMMMMMMTTMMLMMMMMLKDGSDTLMVIFDHGFDRYLLLEWEMRKGVNENRISWTQPTTEGTNKITIIIGQWIFISYTIDSKWPEQAELQDALDKAHAEIERLSGKQALETSLGEQCQPNQKKQKTGNQPPAQTTAETPQPAPSSRGGARHKVTWLAKLKASLCAVFFWNIIKCEWLGGSWEWSYNWLFEDIPRTAAAKAARLRRVCERKPTGKLGCPEWLHEMWKNPNNRQSLTEKLEASSWDKDFWTCCVVQFIFCFEPPLTSKIFFIKSCFSR